MDYVFTKDQIQAIVNHLNEVPIPQKYSRPLTDMIIEITKEQEAKARAAEEKERKEQEVAHVVHANEQKPKESDK
jgi:hypothetical protein